MAGLNLGVGGFGGVGTTSQPQWGTSTNYGSVSAAAFGPGATIPTQSAADALTPNDGFGVATWVGVAAVAGLILIRHSLPS